MPQTARIPPVVWEAQRPRITELYVSQDKTLDEVIQIMAESGFHATKPQYIRKINANWKLQKNYTKEKWQHASALVEKRQAEGKLTKLSIDGKVISEKRRKKELRRYRILQVEEELRSQPPRFSSNQQNGPLDFSKAANPLLSVIHTTREMATGSLPLPEPPGSVSDQVSSHLDIKYQIMFELVPTLGNPMEMLRHQEPPWLQIFNSLVFLCSNNLMETESSAYELLQVAISSGFLIKMKHLFKMRVPTLEIFARYLLFVALRVQGSRGVEFLHFLLESGVSPDSIDPNDCIYSALHRAVIERNRDAVQLLLKSGADPNGKIEDIEDNELDTPLNSALYIYGDGDLAKLLIDSGADVNFGFEKPLIQAARNGNSVLIRDMLEAGADPKTLPAKGLSVMYRAIRYQQLSLVTILIEAGMDPNLSISEFDDHDIQFMVHELDLYGETGILTPLHYAVLSGDVRIVKHLIKCGAVLDRFIDPEMLKESDDTLPSKVLTPLQMSVQEMEEEITKVLLDAGASVDFRHPATGTALQLVCGSKMQEGAKIELTKVLLAKGADVNSVPGEPGGRTAMQAAARSGNHDLLKLLSIRGGNPFASAAKENGLTVFQAALRSHSAALVAYVFWELESSCGCLSFFDGTNYLEEAVSTGNIEILETVLKFWNRHGQYWPKGFISSALKTAVRSGFIYRILGPNAKFSTTRLFTIPEEDFSSLICESIWNVGTADTRTWVMDNGETISACYRDMRVFDLLMPRFIKPSIDWAQPGYPTPLWLAIHQGEHYMAERLLDAGANPNKPSPVVCRNAYHECCHDTGPEMPLKQAICRFDSRLIRLLTDKGANIHCLIDGSSTPLLVSLEIGNGSAAVFFLYKGADPNVVDISGTHTALGLALEQVVSLPTVQLLIQHGADVNRASVLGTPLAQVARGDLQQDDTVQRCQLLLAAGADVNASNNGTTALELAVHDNNTDLEKLLVEAGANLNASSVQTSVLQLAIIKNNLELVLLFLAEGADVNHSTLGGTVLQRAASVGNLKIVEHIIDKGANVNAKSPGSLATALQYAAMHGSVEIVKYLVEHGASVNEEASPFYKATALGLAVANNHTQTAMYLIKKGSSVNANLARYDDGVTILQLAARHGNREIVTRLVENGATVNAPPGTERGATALQFAAINGDIKMAVFFLENGARVSAKGAEIDGRTALEGAAEHGRLDMVHLLLDNDEEPETIEERCCNAAEFAEAEHHDVIARILRNYKRP
ncbi:hypothetical protein BFJ72_g5190 [Fusarium proliferatum]|uniref:Clr5 domain-containing protein n=1 Tax=Gibberella intermedia TaxID=948311 RepID=A0A420TK16_GIBIN|nr:hypothetical protein BFJ72_g5190 [Fusarium proliferatum]